MLFAIFSISTIPSGENLSQYLYPAAFLTIALAAIAFGRDREFRMVNSVGSIGTADWLIVRKALSAFWESLPLTHRSGILLCAKLRTLDSSLGFVFGC